MNQKGLLRKQSFGLPLIDTVGKTAYGSLRTEAAQQYVLSTSSMISE
jgi:hypothetical protein